VFQVVNSAGHGRHPPVSGVQGKIFTGSGLAIAVTAGLAEISMMAIMQMITQFAAFCPLTKFGLKALPTTPNMASAG